MRITVWADEILFVPYFIVWRYMCGKPAIISGYDDSAPPYMLPVEWKDNHPLESL